MQPSQIVVILFIVALVLWMIQSALSQECYDESGRVNVSTNGYCGPANNDLVCPFGQCCGYGWDSEDGILAEENLCGGSRSSRDDSYCASESNPDSPDNFGLLNGKYDGKYQHIWECGKYEKDHPEICEIGEWVTYEGGTPPPTQTPVPTYSHFNTKLQTPGPF